MKSYRPALNIVSQAGRFLILFVLSVLLASKFLVPYAQAIDYPKLNARSLTVGSTIPGEATTYTVSWQYPAATTIGSIRFEICTSAFIDDPCINPAGNMSAASLLSQTGITGFSILSQSTGEVLLSRPSAAASTVQSTYVLDNVSNPAGLQSKFFIRISTYPTADGTGAFNHFSSVASATAEPIVITSEVPPILYFCAALTITEWCGSIGGNFIDYGDLSPLVEDAAVSQFGVATNATGGYVVTVNGDTMSAGVRTIPALAAPAPNTPGTAQFGINLRANTNPPNGQDVFGPGLGTVAAAYDTPDMFQYNDGDMVAFGLSGSLFDTYTVTYIVNVPPDQASGVYNTTVTYICTAAF